jgi:hypothetical protein
MGAPSLDQLRLLYVIHALTGADVQRNGRTRWVKDLQLSVIVYFAIEKRLFESYDWAPSLVEFHGVKMYGKVSQEARADLRKLQEGQLIEKLHLSTCLYDSIRAYRSTPRAASALDALGADDRRGLDGLLLCPSCGALREVMAFVERSNGHWGQVKNAAVSYCPRCCIVKRSPKRNIVAPDEKCRTEIPFFDLADVAYRSKAFHAGGLR